MVNVQSITNFLLKLATLAKDFITLWESLNIIRGNSVQHSLYQFYITTIMVTETSSGENGHHRCCDKRAILCWLTSAVLLTAIATPAANHTPQGNTHLEYK